MRESCYVLKLADRPKGLSLLRDSNHSHALLINVIPLSLTCHSRRSGNPPYAYSTRLWIPTCVGMTTGVGAEIGVIRFGRGDPLASLRVTNHMNVRVTYCPLRRVILLRKDDSHHS